jgi:hypothetical protein
LDCPLALSAAAFKTAPAKDWQYKTAIAKGNTKGQNIKVQTAPANHWQEKLVNLISQSVLRAWSSMWCMTCSHPAVVLQKVH